MQKRALLVLLAAPAVLQAQTKLYDFENPAGGTLGTDVVGGPDLDGDGVSDFAAGDDYFGKVTVWSGRTGAELYQIHEPSLDDYGGSLDFVPDIDGDGVPELIVGAEEAFTDGAVEVRSGVDGAWLFLLFGAGGSDSRFGASVAGISDLDGDGLGDIIVGAPFSDDDKGSVHVFSGGELLAGAGGLIRIHPNLIDHGGYGSAVAAVGDLDGDGIEDYSIGDPGHTGNKGAVWHFSGKNGNQLGAGTFGEADHQQLGRSVAGAGDVDANGWPDIIAGAPGHATPGMGTSNYAYVVMTSTIPPITELLHGWPADPKDGFGWSVAGVGDLDADGFAEVAVGAPSDNAFGLNGGRVYVFERQGLLDWPVVVEVFSEGPHEWLGWDVDGTGDVNGDGGLDLVVGARLGHRVRVHSTVPVALAAASAVAVGAGCGTPAPVLDMGGALPILGGPPFGFKVSSATPGAPGFLYWSPGPTSPIDLGDLGGGCVGWLNPSALYVFEPLTIGALTGFWTSNLYSLPYDHNLAGKTVRLQAAIVGGAGPLGLDLTNAMELVFGV